MTPEQQIFLKKPAFCRESSVSIESLKQPEKQLWQMAHCEGVFNAFATNRTDEDGVTENGIMRGYFKCQAPPILSYSINGRLDLFLAIQDDISSYVRANPNSTYEEALDYLSRADDTRHLAEEALTLHRNWSEACLAQPKQMEDVFVEILHDQITLDKRLRAIFNAERIPQNAPVSNQIGTYTSRLRFAVNTQNPFFDIEGAVDDKKSHSPLNPIRNAQEGEVDQDANPGGQIDTLLTASVYAFKDILVDLSKPNATPTWAEIESKAQEILVTEKRGRALAELAWRLNRHPSDVLFALWHRHQLLPQTDIPASPEAAMTAVEKAMEEAPGSASAESQLVRSAKKINALLGAHNDLPAIRSSANFSGDNMCFSAIRDTATSLLALVEKHHSEIFEPHFDQHFTTTILPQLKTMSHESAMGRYLVELFLQRQAVLDPHFLTGLREYNTEADWERYIGQLEFMRKRDQVRHIGDGIQPRHIIGGKAKSTEDVLSLGLEVEVPRGFVLTSEGIREILQQDPVLVADLKLLESERDTRQIAILSERIRRRIAQLPLTPELAVMIEHHLDKLGNDFIVRSSGSIEDPDRFIQNTSGLHESVRAAQDTPASKIERFSDALLASVTSYFTDPAIAFRNATGHTHKPGFAVLVQEYVAQKMGGVGKIIHDPDHPIVQVTIADDASNITKGSNHFTEVSLNFETGEFTLTGQQRSIPDNLVKKFQQISADLARLKQRHIIFEWGLSESDTFYLFQSNAYAVEQTKTEKEVDLRPLVDLVLDESTDFAGIGQMLIEQNVKAHITLQLDLDDKRLRESVLVLLINHQNRIKQVTTLRPEGSIQNSTAHFPNFVEGLGIKVDSVIWPHINGNSYSGNPIS